MAQWISLVVLSLAVVSTLSFPHDAAYKIPRVGLGNRAQYYVLHDDGSYKFGYDTADGAYEQAMASAPGQVNGEFGYKDPTGANVKLQYTADDRGFIASGDHLPVAPEAGATVYAAPHLSAAPTVYTGTPSHVSPVFPSSDPVEVANVVSSAGEDGSYSFGYRTSSSSRQESGDADNSVSGQYSFVADDGIDRSISYRAGSETGYIAKGDSIPVGPSVPGAESGQPTGEIYPILSEDEANALARATSTNYRSSATGSGSGATSATYHSAGAPSLTFGSSGTGSSITQYSASDSDASYSFSYDAGDSSRVESSDSDLNVKGSYSFSPPDTQHKLTVNYHAGADTGFVATGDHLPVAPEAGSSATAYTAPSAYHLPAAPTVYTGTPSHVSPPVFPSSDPVEVASIRSSAGADGSYNFGYKTSSSSRQESGDADNSVSGQYSFVADDGIDRSISYRAGSETGYIAKGDSIPVGPSVPGAESGQPTGEIYPILSEDEANALARATSTNYRKATSTATHGHSSFTGTHSAAPTVYTAPTTSDSDASYSFSYDAGDSSRVESSDSDLNVKGSYSFSPPDTQHKLTVNYHAGADTGFVATGDHLPVAPEAGSSATAYTAPSVHHLSAAPTVYTGTPSHTSPVFPSLGPVEVASVRSSAGEDGSYSFGYRTSSSSRQESGDADNSVSGQYSFVADDGIDRSISYRAGSETGYIAKGDSIPVGPSVPGAESGQPTGEIYPILSEDEANALARATSTNYRSSATGSGSGATSATYHSAGAPSLTFGSSGTGSGITQYSASDSDASYSFSYDASDSSRVESSDSDLNVKGSYSFSPPDTNQKLTVDYKAGSDTGFVATGDHLPVAPEAKFPAGSASPTYPALSGGNIKPAAPTVYTAPTASHTFSTNLENYGSSGGHTSAVVGDVLLHQYGVAGKKFGYAFSAV